LLSRESFLLANNLLLTLFTALVLFGTLAPLIYEAMAWGKISVGFPWFNKMFLAVMPILALFLGVGHLTRWKHDDAARLVRQLWIAAVLTLGLTGLAFLPAVSGGYWLVPLGLGLAAWITLSHLTGLYDRLRHKRGLSGVLADLTSNSRSYYGMLLAHLGVAVFIVGVTLVSHFGVEKDVRMSPGSSQEVSGYRFQFDGATPANGPNYKAWRGHFRVFQGDRQIATLEPEKRSYLSGGMPMTEAAILAGLNRDLYVSLGEPVDNKGDWALRLYYKPYVRWIWLGAIFMGLGGILTLSDRRYRSATQRVRGLDSIGAQGTARI
jgi:cytochrome c-type biogenesis protein CcmF